MKKVFKLFIDESGQHEKSHPSSYFSFVGVIVEQSRQAEIKNDLDHIKFKYWGHTNVVLHSEEIARNSGDFKIFKNKPELKEEFLNDIYDYLRKAPFVLTTCSVDKNKVYGLQWKEDTVLTKATDAVFLDFVNYIYTKLPASGKIIFEASSPLKDNKYMARFSYFASNNIVHKYPDFVAIRDKLTSITFATKLNHDTETQIADLFGHIATCKMLQAEGAATYEKNSYEAKMIKILDSKTLKKPNGVTKPEKQAMFGAMNGYKILP